MLQLDKQRILAIARESAARGGFVLYADFNRYLRELIRHRKLDPVDAGWCLWEIKRILLDAANNREDRYFYGKIGNKACFYPLSSDLFAEEENKKQSNLFTGLKGTKNRRKIMGSKGRKNVKKPKQEKAKGGQTPPPAEKKK